LTVYEYNPLNRTFFRNWLMYAHCNSENTFVACTTKLL